MHSMSHSQAPQAQVYIFIQSVLTQHTNRRRNYVDGDKKPKLF